MNIMSIDKELMSPFLMPTLHNFPGPGPKAKLKNRHFFQVILNMKFIRQMFAYTEVSVKQILISCSTFMGIPISMRICTIFL
jgi:hypothetical protein